MGFAASHDDLVSVALAHAAAEAEDDIDTVLATLEDNPVYELHPLGVAFRGMDAARRYYEHFFSTFQPSIADFTLRGQWVNEQGVAQEYTIWTNTGPDGGVERHDVFAILTFGTTLLSGERLYSTERLVRLLFGPVVDEAEPIAVGYPPD